MSRVSQFAQKVDARLSVTKKSRLRLSDEGDCPFRDRDGRFRQRNRFGNVTKRIGQQDGRCMAAALKVADGNKGEAAKAREFLVKK